MSRPMQERLIEEAARVLYYNPQASTEQIAKAAGCSRRTIERHYPKTYPIREYCCERARTAWRKERAFRYWFEPAELGMLEGYFERASKLGYDFLLLMQQELYSEPGKIRSLHGKELIRSGIADELIDLIANPQYDKVITNAYSSQWVLMMFITMLRFKMEARTLHPRFKGSRFDAWTSFTSFALNGRFNRRLFRFERRFEKYKIGHRVLY